MTAVLPAPRESDDQLGSAASRDVPDAETLRAIAEAVRGSFPRPLITSELVLIDVNPYQFHAFWNLTVVELEAARQRLPNEDKDAPMVLCVSGIVGGDTFDIKIQGLQNQIYVDVWSEERQYRAVLGLRRNDGSIVPLLSSNPVILPNLPRSAEPARSPEPEHALEARSSSQTERFPAVAAAGAEGAQRTDESAAGKAGPLELETVLALSSFAMGRETVQLEINAELRIFGRTKPGSELQLFGRRVALKPDGSFSIARPLPNGALVVTALLAGNDSN